MIRPLDVNDANDLEAVARIYNHYIINTAITFEELPIDADIIRTRVEKVTAAGLPWLIAEQNGEVIGYAYAAPWRERSAYRFSVEVSAYLDKDQTGNGWGTRLFEELFARLRQRSIHVAIGGITLPNAASVALHEKFGMKKVAHYPEVGYKFERWLDVGYWQVILAE